MYPAQPSWKVVATSLQSSQPTHTQNFPLASWVPVLVLHPTCRIRRKHIGIHTVCRSARTTPFSQETIYLVKWKGYPASKNTWETIENVIVVSNDLLDEYYRRQPSGKASANAHIRGIADAPAHRTGRRS